MIIFLALVIIFLLAGTRFQKCNFRRYVYEHDGMTICREITYHKSGSATLVTYINMGDNIYEMTDIETMPAKTARLMERQMERRSENDKAG